MSGFEFRVPTRIVFGRGRVAELGARLPGGAARVLVVTDPNLASRTGALDAVRKALGGRDVRIFDGVEENPSLASVEAGAEEARRFGADGIIGLGGGSPMDAAKGIALLAANPGPLAGYLDGAPLVRPPLPVAAVPTTSGTGSEVTPYAVFTDPGLGNKRGYAHDGLFPAVAVVDPELTYSMPEPVVINTGLDVVTHAAEAFLSTQASPLSDGAASAALDIAMAELVRAAEKDRRAMDLMAAASVLAGIAITHGGTILPHIMGYPLTMDHGVAHGRACAVLLGPVLDFLLRCSRAPERARAIAARFDPHGGVAGFLRRLGVPSRLSDYGVRKGEIGLFAGKTIVKGDIKITPAEVTEETLAEIYLAAL